MKQKIFLGLLGFFLLAQLIRPNLDNPVADSSLDISFVKNPPSEVMTILRDACYDCHSNETKWIWYSNITPVNWWLRGHVMEGREHLNFSEFGKLSVSKQLKALGESAEEVEKGKMPLNNYTWTHPEARLSPAQKQTLLAWLDANGSREEENEKED